jgi:transcription termination factor Rho
LTIEEAIEQKPAPRRRSTRSRTAAVTEAPVEQLEPEVAASAVSDQPDAVQFVDVAALPEVTTPAIDTDTFRQPEAVSMTPESAAEPPEPFVPPVSDGETPPVQLVAETEAPTLPVATPVREAAGEAEPIPDGRGDFSQRQRGRDSRSRRDRGSRPPQSDRSNGAERSTLDGRDSRDGRPPVYGQQRPRNGGYNAQITQTRGTGPHLSVMDLEARTADELAEMARQFEIAGFARLPRTEQIVRLLRAQTEKDGQIFGDGILEIIEDGFGFLRGQRFLPGPDDIYVSQSQIRRFGLRTGDRVCGQVRPPKDNEKFFSLLRVEAVNGIDPETARRRPSFDTLTPIFPLELINLETAPHILSTRLLNLVAPIGRGQRGLIVSPPKAGKTMLLKAIANGITANCPDIHLMVCLIGERPEEVTDMRRSIEGEVISSTFDEPVEDHTKVAEMALERAKRLVEGGRDVVILLDSITRLARAYNLAVPPSGRTLSGGIDPVALYPPKRFFGAARNIEGGGSLTVVSTCLIDTGSRMDDVIYEEFKGTGNMELHLDRKLAERRIYPSIDVQRSGTRREELLLDESTLRQVWTMRRMVSMLGGSEGTELLLGRLAKTQTNEEFLETLNRDV